MEFVLEVKATAQVDTEVNVMPVIDNSGTAGTSSVYNQITVDSTGVVEVKAGDEKLENRKSVTMNAHPENTGYIYVGLNTAVSTSKWFCILQPGAFMDLKLLDGAMSLWVTSDIDGQYLGVSEISPTNA